MIDHNKIFDVISRYSNMDRGKIGVETSIIDDLGMDFIDIVELSMDLEKEFNISIRDYALEDFDTVGEIILYLEGLLPTR